MIKCDGIIKLGLGVYVDFSKIVCLCICIVILLFVGKLYVIVWNVIYVGCKNRVIVNIIEIFNCNDKGFKEYNV